MVTINAELFPKPAPEASRPGRKRGLPKHSPAINNQQRGKS
jgi:hypothetical protein